MTVFTIGYEGIEIETFLELLNANHIETLVDVRELPLSRKPGFSKRTLAELLSSVGTAYVHVPALGCPKAVRARAASLLAGIGNMLASLSNSVRYVASKVQVSEANDLSALFCTFRSWNDYSIAQRSFTRSTQLVPG